MYPMGTREREPDGPAVKDHGLVGDSRARRDPVSNDNGHVESVDEHADPEAAGEQRDPERAKRPRVQAVVELDLSPVPARARGIHVRARVRVVVPAQALTAF